MIGLGVALLLCLLVGRVVDRAWLGDPSTGWIERVGRGLLLGLGLVGSLSMALDSAGLGVSRLHLGLALAALLAIAARPALRRSAHERAAPPEPAGLGALALLLVAAVGMALVVRSGWLRPAFQFDSLTRWMFKAKVLFYEGTLFGPVSTDAAFAFTHQRYPPLVAHIANLPALVNGQFDDRVASALFPWFAVALVGTLYGALRRRTGAFTAAFGAAWIAHLPLIAYVASPPPGSGAFSAMADVPLALFVAGATLAAMDAVSGARPRAALEAGVLLGVATLTKNEGLPLLVGLPLGVVLAGGRTRLRAALGIGALGAAWYLALWGAHALGLPASDEHYPAQLRPSVVLQHLDRLPLLAGAYLGELVNVRSWNVTWPAVITLLVVGRAALRRPGPRLVLVVIAVQLAAYTLAFVVTRWTSFAAEIIAQETGGDPLQTLLELTLGRLVLHVAPLAIALALMACPVGRQAGVVPDQQPT